MKKIIIIIVVIFALVGLTVGAIMQFAPQSGAGQAVMSMVGKFTPKKEKAEDAKGITVTAAALAKEYSTDEKAADTKYLNKAVEVSGTVGEFEKNQDGGLMVVLTTDDPTAGVQCTMREKNATVAKGQNITIKGFCSGNGITGVSLTDCIAK